MRRYLIVSDSIISRRRCNNDTISYTRKNKIHFQIYPTIALMHTCHVRYVSRPEPPMDPPRTTVVKNRCTVRNVCDTRHECLSTNIQTIYFEFSTRKCIGRLEMNHDCFTRVALIITTFLK